MERREDFIKKQEAEKAQKQAKAETEQDRKARVYFEQKAQKEAQSAERANAKRIKEAEKQVEQLEQNVTRYEAITQQGAALLERLEQLEKEITSAHQEAIKAAGIGFPNPIRQQINAAVKEQRTVNDKLEILKENERKRLESTYKILLEAGKLKSSDKKKKGLFK